VWGGIFFAGLISTLTVGPLLGSVLYYCDFVIVIVVVVVVVVVVV
jgi:hypothetical protein